MKFYFSCLIEYLLAACTLVCSSYADNSSADDSSIDDSSYSTRMGKNETTGNNVHASTMTTLFRRSPSTQKSDTPEEDLYIKYFGNYAYEYSSWDVIKKWYYEYEPRLLEFCTEAHKLAGIGDLRADGVMLNVKQLVFTNENYKARRIDIITYGVSDWRSAHEEKPYWYITEGVRKDCVFYLDKVDKSAREFKIRKHVCGIKIF